MPVYYREYSAVSAGMKAFWGLAISLFVVMGFALYQTGDIAGAAAVAAAAVFFLVLALALTPRELVIDSSGITIRLRLGYTVTISAARLKQVSQLPAWRVFLSEDVPFKSAWSVPVHIAQKRGLAFVVTPAKPDEFVSAAARMLRPAEGDAVLTANRREPRI